MARIPTDKIFNNPQKDNSQKTLQDIFADKKENRIVKDNFLKDIIKNRSSGNTSADVSSGGPSTASKRNINNRASISGRKFGSQSAPQVNEDGDFGHFEAFKKQISEKRF